MPEQTEPTTGAGDQQVRQPTAALSAPLEETRRQFVAAAEWARIPLLATDGTGKTTTNMQNITEAVEQGKPLTPEQVQQTRDAIKLLDSNEIINTRPILQQLKDTFAVLSSPGEQQAQRPVAPAAPVASPMPELAAKTAPAAKVASPAPEPAPEPVKAAPAPAQLKPTTRPAAKAKRPTDDRDEFIRNALPVAAALRRSGKPEEAKQLELVANALLQTKSMERTPAPAQAPAPGQEESLKNLLANVYKAIDQDPALRNMPEAKSMRRAGNKLDKDGMLNITVRNGVVVSFVSNFTDNFSRTQQGEAAETKPAVAQREAAPAVKPATISSVEAAQPSEAPAVVATPAVGAPAAGAVAQTAPAEAADAQLRVATIILTYDNPTGERKGMAAAMTQNFLEAGAKAEVLSTKPAQDKSQSVSELKISYCLDDPNINKVSALFDVAAIMNGSKLREEPGDKQARKEAASQADDRQAKEAREQRRAQVEQQRQAQQQADGRARAQQLVEQPAPLFQAYPAYTSFAPSTETGVIDNRKAIPHDSPQLNVAISDQGEFGLNPKVDQKRLIGDGIASLGQFFEYALPTSGHKIAHVGLAEPGQLKQTERGWEVVTKGKLAITDTEGNVFKPQVSEAPAMAPAPATTVAAQVPAAAPTPAAGQRFALSDLPVELLDRVGVPVAELERTGQLQKLLAGKKTDLIPGLQLPGPDGQPTAFAAKLVLDRDAQGVATLRVDLPKRELEIPPRVLGKEITPAMQEQLKTTGVVPLLDGFRDGKGQPFAAYLAVDPEMKRVVAVRPEGITLPQEVYGVKLSPEQQKSLLEGKPARIEGMTQPGAKQLVDALVQLDPLARKLVFRDTRPRLAPEQLPAPVQQPPRRQGVRL